MSAETKAALDAAIEAHIIDSTGDHCAALNLLKLPAEK